MTYEGLYEQITQHGLLHTIEETKGEFLVIFYDDNLNKIYVANDRLGREPLFYFYDGKDFIVSDDFWEIINVIEPTESDVDVQSIKEFVIFSNPLFYKTIVKNLNFLPPASIGEISLPGKKFELKQYWDFCIKEDNAPSIEDAVERTDRIFDSIMKQIHDKNDPNATYGVGLSGGLDSRLIPYYASRHNMRLTSFIIGEKKPHGLMLSNDHKHARQVARYYGLDHHEIEYDSEKFERKGFYDVRYNPMSTSQFFKIARENLPRFDIYLNGTFGAIIGSIDYPSDVEDISKRELLDMIISLFSDINTVQTHRRLRFALKFLFRHSTSSTNKDRIEGVISKEEFALSVEKIRQFIEDNSDKSNVNILYKYLLNHLGGHSKYGAYESLLGWKKSYTYYPYLLDEVLTWNKDLLRNRLVLKSLFLRKLPELAKIRAQGLDEALFYQGKQSNVIRKAFSLAEYVLRGQGVMRASKWAKEKKYAEYTLGILSKETKIFRSIFDIDKVKKFRVQSVNIYDNLVKLKYILDLIETRDYKNFNFVGTKDHRG